jgi:hypothetical protein
MKITQILSLLIFITCFSCDRRPAVDNNGIANERKKDSLDRVQSRAHSDSIQQMYISIKMPGIWNEVKMVKGKATILKGKDTLYPHQSIYIDISTEPQAYIIWNLEGEKSQHYIIKNVLEQGDSALFSTVEWITEKPVKWIFKYTNIEKKLGSWSVQHQATNVLIVTGKYISVKGQYE